MIQLIYPQRNSAWLAVQKRIAVERVVAGGVRLVAGVPDRALAARRGNGRSSIEAGALGFNAPASLTVLSRRCRMAGVARQRDVLVIIPFMLIIMSRAICKCIRTAGSVFAAKALASASLPLMDSFM